MGVKRNDDDDDEDNSCYHYPHPIPSPSYRAHVRSWFSSVAQSFWTLRLHGLRHVRLPLC